MQQDQLGREVATGGDRPESPRHRDRQREVRGPARHRRDRRRPTGEGRCDGRVERRQPHGAGGRGDLRADGEGGRAQRGRPAQPRQRTFSHGRPANRTFRPASETSTGSHVSSPL